MIHLKSIYLKNFKGTPELTCEFDDFTLLAGLNNSGKTTIVQAIFLLTSAIKEIIESKLYEHTSPDYRRIYLSGPLSTMGFRTTNWLGTSSNGAPVIRGIFRNDLTIELTIFLDQSGQIEYSLSHTSSAGNALKELQDIKPGILAPPGEVPTRERMLSGDEFRQKLQDGSGAQLWRNGLWWAMQRNGAESFAPIQERVQKYFPDVKLTLPRLSEFGETDILINYDERGVQQLDIAQSGTGLRTFMSLSQILDQSNSDIVLLDEPDAHLHASQQTVILELMLDAATSGNRQVIVTSHSPEIISRAPPESIRWVNRDNPIAVGGFETDKMLDQLGATSDLYIARTNLPDILVYVEGVDDRPTIEALIKWCRQRVPDLPSTLVIPHRDGRFETDTIKGIVRFANGIKQKIRVVGIRDLDFFYDQTTIQDTSNLEGQDNWSLLTLPCKELENLFCDPFLLFQNFDREISFEELKSIVSEQSKDAELVDQWKYQLLSRIRECLPKKLDPSTKEKEAEDQFRKWNDDENIRNRLVAGKGLLRKIRKYIDNKYGKRFYPSRMLEKCESLTPHLSKIANCIFPGITIKVGTNPEDLS